MYLNGCPNRTEPNWTNTKQTASVKVSSITSTATSQALGGHVGVATTCATSKTQTGSSTIQTVTSGKQQPLLSANSKHNQSASSGGGNAKYLRYVRSKLSKSRLNSVLSLSGVGSGGGKDSTSPSDSLNPSFFEQASGGTINAGLNQSRGSAGGNTNEPADQTGGPLEQLVDQEQTGCRELFEKQQQQQLSTSDAASCSLLAKGVLIRTSQQIEMQRASLMKVHKPIGPSLSNEPAPISAFDLQQQQAGATTTTTTTNRQGTLRQQASMSKKSNFFSGFRSTLRGRRGSKQQASQQQQQQTQQPKSETRHSGSERGQPQAGLLEALAQPITGSHSMGEITGTEKGPAAEQQPLGDSPGAMITSASSAVTSQSTSTTITSYFATLASGRPHDTPTRGSASPEPPTRHSSHLFKVLTRSQRHDSFEQD